MQEQLLKEMLRGINNKPRVQIKWNHKNIARYPPGSLCVQCDLLSMSRLQGPDFSFIWPLVQDCEYSWQFWEVRSHRTKAGWLTACYKSAGPGFLSHNTNPLCIWDHCYHLWDLELREPTQNYADVHVAWCARSNKLSWLNAVSLTVYFWYHGVKVFPWQNIINPSKGEKE